MKGGPTVRTGPFGASGTATVSVETGVAITAAGVAAVPGLAGFAPFGSEGCGGCERAFAFWSVTTMSPLSSVVESSAFFSASAQLWPGRRHEQAAVNSLRYWKAAGKAV